MWLLTWKRWVSDKVGVADQKAIRNFDGLNDTNWRFDYNERRFVRSFLAEGNRSNWKLSSENKRSGIIEIRRKQCGQ